MPLVEVKFPGNLASVADIASLRALPSSNLRQDAAYLAGDDGLFLWDGGSLIPDDGASTLKPDDLTSLQVGRWLLSGNAAFSKPIVRASLADLKAAPITGLVSLYDGSVWSWTVGNFAGQADDLYIVQSDQAALSVGAWVRKGRLPELNVLDLIPDQKHGAIAAGTITEDLTSYVQEACRRARRVIFPAGTYPIGRIGIRDTVLIGSGDTATTLHGVSGGTAAEFMLDAMLDTDGATSNTAGNGWAQDMTLDVGDGTRSGLRTYGGGAYVCNMRFLGLQVGASFGLPIWMKAHNLFSQSCKVAGFHTFSGPGDTATSLSMDNCWALSCYRGFHITQLAYSTFNACVAQECTEKNWYVEGDANGVAACYSLTFISPATEGAGTPFYFKKVRDLVVINPRVISPDGAADLMTLDDVSGSIVNYSTPGTPPGGKAHLNIINHTAGNGAIGAVNCVVSLASPSQRAFLSVMGSNISGSQRTTSGRVLEVDADTIADRRYFDGADIDGYTGLRAMSSDGTRLLALRRIGGVALSSNGPFASPSTSLQAGDLVPYATDANFKIQVKTPNGTLKTITLPYDA